MDGAPLIKHDMKQGKIICLGCGRRLASLLGAIGVRRVLKMQAGARVCMERNALGEELGWIMCPDCKRNTQIDPAYLLLLK